MVSSGPAGRVARPVGTVRLVVWSAVVSLVTFVVGIGALIALNHDQQQAACDLVRAQIVALSRQSPAPGTDEQLAAWVEYGKRSRCLR